MRLLPRNPQTDPNLLVGLDTSDDAGVYKLTEDLAIIQSVDYFTPIVDDPYMFGQIAASNALSDIYAMGGKPVTALNIVGFPISKLDKSILTDILKGAADKVHEAGATIIGGHSIDDQEPKFGMAVTGVAHPDRILTNSGACVGDVLVLTKPIGVGILSKAIKEDLLDAETAQLAAETMAQLNKGAAEAMDGLDIHGCTDVTGFGLLGHASEMAEGSGVGLEIDHDRVPVLPRTMAFAEQGVVPGGSKSNHHWLREKVSYPDDMTLAEQWVFCDAVTSGGLLVSLPEDQAETYLKALQEKGVGEAVVIGKVVADHPGKITLK